MTQLIRKMPGTENEASTQTHPLFVVANVLLDHNVKNFVFVKVPEGGFPERQNTKEALNLLTQTHNDKQSILTQFHSEPKTTSILMHYFAN